jgi:hypothetical protein
MPLLPLLPSSPRQGLWKSLDTPNNPLKNTGLVKNRENPMFSTIDKPVYFCAV